MAQNAASLIEIVSIASGASGIVGGMSTLVVDVIRRQVKAKASEYAAKDAFQNIVKSANLLQFTLDSHIKQTAENHIVLCERITRLEAFNDLSNNREI
jgi:hypothetical protein